MGINLNMRCIEFRGARSEMAIPCLDDYDHKFRMVNELLMEIAGHPRRLKSLYICAREPAASNREQNPSFSTQVGRSGDKVNANLQAIFTQDIVNSRLIRRRINSFGAID
jgi:hypothetical protein